MAYRSDPSLVVLHVLKLKGFAEVDAIAELSGVALADVDQHLAAAAEAGLAQRREGRISGWSLTPRGRALQAEQLEAELGQAESLAPGARDVLAGVYGAFAGLNGRLKQVCTHWQLRTVGSNQVPNNHGDPDYDAAVVASLRALDEDAQPLCATLGETLERMARYGPRLRRALTRLQGGDRDRFTRPLSDSYHDIWMELHEDLIATLKLVRTPADA
jgi:DNA-binding MarR family transcriptional regulator